MKLTKAEIKIQKQVFELLKKDNLTNEEIDWIYENINAGYISDVTTHSFYQTPLNLSYDAVLMWPTHGVLIDMAAGFGILTHCAKIRDGYNKDIKHYVCIERNPVYIEIGKKLCPYADWIEGDIFNKNVWDSIKQKYGRIDCIMSNPPFGKVSKSDADKSWLKYKGSDLEIAAIEVALVNCDKQYNCSFILPVGSLTFRKNMAGGYMEHVQCRKIDKLKKEMGVEFYMSWCSIDTDVYEGFKNTKIRVECCTIDDFKYITE